MYVCLYVCKETYIKKVTKQKQTKITIMPMIKVDSKHMEGLKKAEWSKLDQNWKTFSIKRKNLFVEINDNEFIKW